MVNMTTNEDEGKQDQEQRGWG
jgi:hypothetical protein